VSHVLRRTKAILRTSVFTAVPLLTVNAGHAFAQVVSDTTQTEFLQAPDTVRQRSISPRGAMFRSFLLPGWGQAAVGSYFRGGVWFSVEATSVYMLLRTIGRLNQVEDTEARLVAFVTDSLNGVIEESTKLRHLVVQGGSTRGFELADTTTTAFEDAIAADSSVAIARKLIDARRQQRQDWITYTLFFTLLSGVDAYVNAHLKDFPTSIATELRRDGTLGLSVHLPLPGLLGGTSGVPASVPARASPIRR
jgi:Family of unknown function (DUF5683)